MRLILSALLFYSLANVIWSVTLEEIDSEDHCGPLFLTVARGFVNEHQNRCCYFHDKGYDDIPFLKRWFSGNARLPKDEAFCKCLQEGPGWDWKGVGMCFIVGTPSVLVGNIENEIAKAAGWAKDKLKKLWGFIPG